MTIDELIEQLTHIREAAGGDMEVTIVTNESFASIVEVDTDWLDYDDSESGTVVVAIVACNG